MNLNDNSKLIESYSVLKKSQGEAIKGQKEPFRFCRKCQRKTCLKTRRICFRLERYLKKRVEIKFWHGVESYLDKQTFVFMQSKLYGIKNKEDRENYENSIHI